ncbi:MAG: transcriptional regulator, MarR family [Ilumatobacteraceae bacterium]|nr:transcriptional regulator, MarR family [Ilumatobacteraceae bacterium]MCU1387329.1 transcriptional regulator, MarR family [Ilumatobacteraceae bacterium]
MQQPPPTLTPAGDDGVPDARGIGTEDGGEDGIAAVAEAVLTASRALVAVAARSLATVDAQVTVPQFRALVVLSSRGPQPVGELADALAIHPSTATRLCDRLVSKRLVRRAVSRENRRETTISLSPAGRDLVDEVTNIRHGEIAAIVARVPVQTRAAMVAALTAFAEAAGELPRNTWILGWK